jgi:hypothetical protein
MSIPALLRWCTVSRLSENRCTFFEPVFGFGQFGIIEFPKFSQDAAACVVGLHVGLIELAGDLCVFEGEGEVALFLVALGSI